MQSEPLQKYVGRVVHLIRQEKRLKQSELALLTGLKQPNLSRIENALVEPRATTLEKLAKALGVDVHEFHSEARMQEVERKWAASLGPKHAALMMAGKLTAVPLLDTKEGYPGSVGAHGEPQARLELVMQLPFLGAEASHFAFRVHGDSMEGSSFGDNFRHGEVLVFSIDSEVTSGDLAFVILNDGGCFCRVEMPNPGSLLLVAQNPKYPARMVPRSSVLRTWKLVQHIRAF